MNNDSDNSSIDRHALLLDIIKRYDHYIGTTNFKIALLASFVATVLISFLHFTTKLNEVGLLYKGVIITTITLIALFSLGALYNLLRAVFPITKSSKELESIIFFGDVAGFKSGKDYHQRLQDCDEKLILKDLSTQAYELANILKLKMYYISNAVRILKWLVIPYMITVIIFAYFTLN